LAANLLEYALGGVLKQELIAVALILLFPIFVWAQQPGVEKGTKAVISAFLSNEDSTTH
jgi:hypothetical protein